jgi:formylglycine-generating enzyme required for sulfatase activity
MQKIFGCKTILMLAGLVCFCLASTAQAVDRVVVIPMGGTEGNATASDVVVGKTFSSKAAGKGVDGSLEIRAGGTLYTNSLGMKFSLIPAGSFVMGSPDGVTTVPASPAEPARSSDEKQHVVTLTKPFYMQTTEVTQGQWQQMMGSNPSHFTACGSDCPVEMVSWNDAQNFIDNLNASEGRTNCNTTPNTCYSLPTESQWEYAARGGTVSAFYNGGITNTICSPLDPKLNDIGWYCGNAGSTTHPVAQKAPNNWGLYDMSGNVYELCEDWYGTYPAGPVSDPPGPVATNRVVRGSSWDDLARYGRTASRASIPPDLPTSNVGFRLVLPPGQ